MKNYQMRLDFGEGQECHSLYEYWLEVTGEKDDSRNWEEFKMIYNELKPKHDT